MSPSGLSRNGTMTRFMRKLQDLARIERTLWVQRGVSLRHKIQFAVSRLLLLAGGKSVLWLGRWMKSDNRLGLLLLPEYIDEAVSLVALAQITSADIVVDVGANIGQFTTAIYHVAGCRVVSIEANPEIVSILRRNVGAMSGITVVQAAVGARSEERTHYSVRGKSAQGSFLKGRAVENLAGGVEEKSISVVRLADVMAGVGLGDAPVKCIKIDTEGTEEDVLAGCDGLKIATLQIEIDTREAGQRQRIEDHVAMLLGRTPSVFVSPDLGSGDVVNVVFV
jgi:FkbM family methyltransferase